MPGSGQGQGPGGDPFVVVRVGGRTLRIPRGMVRERGKGRQGLALGASGKNPTSGTSSDSPHGQGTAGTVGIPPPRRGRGRRFASSVPLLVARLEARGLPTPRWKGNGGELRPIPGRQFAFDLSWPDVWLAVEVDGGGFVAGRHGRGTGIELDAEKASRATALGWSVMRVTPAQVRDGRASEWIAAAYAARLSRR